MARLLAITYPDGNRAKQAMASVDWSDFDRLIDVEAACWLRKVDGELEVHPRGHPVAGKASAGGALGLVIGGLIGLPVLGIAAGSAIGAVRGGRRDLGIDDAFLASIGHKLESGGSALVILYEGGADNARAAADLARFGGTAHSADVPSANLARFQAMLDQATADTPRPDVDGSARQAGN